MRSGRLSLSRSSNSRVYKDSMNTGVPYGAPVYFRCFCNKNKANTKIFVIYDNVRIVVYKSRNVIIEL